MSPKILNGNELLIQGGLEAGFHLYTGYPGSPLADFFNILSERKTELRQKGIRVVIANSEANAAAMASGAKMAGQNTLLAMKSMGLHVAADALSVGNFANPGKVKAGLHPGVVVVVGDDPWSISTSTPADSRYLFKHLHIPFLEPATPQELKDWVKVALELSQKSGIYVGLLLTTFMAEGGGRVEVSQEVSVDGTPHELNPQEFNLREHVMVPPNSLMADKAMIEQRFPAYLEILAKKSLDQRWGHSESPIGIISSGAVFEVAKQVLETHSILNKVNLYKVAGAYPLNELSLLPFLKTCQRLLVIEEKRGFLEGELTQLVTRHDLQTEVWGKRFANEEGFPAHGGLSFELVEAGILRVFKNWGGEQHHNRCFDSRTPVDIPKRLPTFCPGCPHRETLSIMKELRGELAAQGVRLLSHGDVGCYSLAFLEPFKEMHDLSAMGQGGALGAGADIFATNPSIVLMGDSTFFHSGMVSISNSVQLDHNITYILLDNDNTAMTGHQATPRTGTSVEGAERPRQSMLEVVRSLGVAHALEIHPSDRYFYKNLLNDLIRRKGVKVVVSTKECALTFYAKKKQSERLTFSQGEVQSSKPFYQINTQVCEDCRECVELTGCPGLTQVRDAYGTKVAIDPQVCVADSYCTKLKVCPSFELVEVSDYHPTKYQPQRSELTFRELPSPILRVKLEDVASGIDWRSIVIGVGGSGVTTITRIIAEAAVGMEGRTDLSFKFVDQKGLAQRNGSVISHLSLHPLSRSHAQTLPLGSAQVVVSPDLLEGARALSYLAPEGLLIIDEDFQTPLSLLTGEEQESGLREESLRQLLRDQLGEQVIMGPFKRLCFERYQRSVYASAMLLGVMFQAGILPFSLKSMREAFERALPKNEDATNWEAFQWGRSWLLERPRENVTDDESQIQLYLLSVKLAAYPWQNAQHLVNSFNHARRLAHELFPTIPSLHFAQYVHDILVYDHGRTIKDYMDQLKQIQETQWSNEEKTIAVRALSKTFFVKDEVMVSHLMVSPMKLKLDQERYQRLGKKFRIIPLNRPAFVFLGKKWEFDLSPRQWMLQLMRHARFLRLLMPSWHRREREIALSIRHKLNELRAKPGPVQAELLALDGVKGYREVRYRKAGQSQGMET